MLPNFGCGWAETFGELQMWLDEVGMTVDRLPAWPDGAPVRVIGTPGRLYLERIPRAAYRQYARMVAAGEMRLRAVPVKRLGKMHEARIVAVDAAKVAAWQAREVAHG